MPVRGPHRVLALQVERLQIGASLHAARIGTDVFAESAELVLNCVIARR